MKARKLGEFIKEKRTEKGLTREELAQQVGVSVSAIMSWEAGRYRPNRNLDALAEALNVSIEDMADHSNPLSKRNGTFNPQPSSNNGNGHHPDESEVVITPPITSNSGILRAKINILQDTAAIRGMLQVARLVGDERTIEVTKMVEEKIGNIEAEARDLDA